MIKRRTSPKIFFGWWTVWVIGVMAGLGQGFYQYGISVFFKPIATSLGLSRGIASLATGVGRLEGGLEAPLTGWLSDALTKAEECTDCGDCETRCPYHLPIRDMIKEQVQWYKDFRKRYAHLARA